MHCPYYKDFVRECAARIAMVPEINTMLFCTTEAFGECPFYRSIEKIACVCEFVETCTLFRHLSRRDFPLFRTTTEQYCLCEGCSTCQRHVIKKSGRQPPPDLMPDGSALHAS
jgi:hypothetical protein